MGLGVQAPSLTRSSLTNRSQVCSFWKLCCSRQAGKKVESQIPVHSEGERHPKSMQVNRNFSPDLALSKEAELLGVLKVTSKCAWGMLHRCQVWEEETGLGAGH